MNSSQEYILSEDHILEIIEKYFPKIESPSMVLDKGDDCTIICPKADSNIVITTDIFAENSHFRRSYFSPRAIGYKALAVNISDIYAMGAMPTQAQLALCVPKNIEKDYVEEIFSSMSTLAKEHGICLSGGDISISDTLMLSITLLGEIEKNLCLYRKNNSIGDIIYISSAIENLGNSRLALLLLEENTQKDTISKSIQDAHLKPPMYREEAIQIAEFAKKNPSKNFSLMDISDGLAQDLPRLLGQYGARLDFDMEKIHLDIKEYCHYNNLNPVEFIVQGGEDYILLGTCPALEWEEFSTFCPQLVKIGEVIEETGIYYKENPITVKGYDHFASEKK